MSQMPNQEQQKLLDFIAKEQLIKKPSDGFPGASWRRLWSQFKPKTDATLRAVLDSCVPTYLSFSPQPNDSYALTLEGWLESSEAPLVSKWLEDILAFLRKRFNEDADFKRYTWQEIQKATKTTPEQAFAVHEMIRLARLSSGGTAQHGSTVLYTFECQTPFDIIEISQCESIDALRQLRAPQDSGPSQQTTRRLDTVSGYFLSLSLEGARCFSSKQTIDFSDGNQKPKQWTLLLGNNGTGKTTILQSIASLISLQDRDARLEFSRAFDVLLSFPRNRNGEACRIEARVAFGNSLSQDSEYQTKDFAWQFLSKQEPKPLPLPLFAYGANRRMGIAVLSQEQLQDPIATLFSDVPLRNAEELLLQYDYIAERESKTEEGKHKTGTGKKAAAMRDKLITLLSSGVLPEVTELRFSSRLGNAGRPQSGVELKTPYGWVPPYKLGLGYQTMLAWIVDLVSRLFELYPDKVDPLSAPAIVLIDEIDIHLHPKWQRELLALLSEHFPNTQFIATAHSPLVVQAATNANVIVLRREDDHVLVEQHSRSVNDWRIDQILTSDLFGLSSAHSSEVEKKFEERRSLLQKKRSTKKEKERLAELNAELKSLPIAQTEEDRETMALLRRAGVLLTEARSK